MDNKLPYYMTYPMPLLYDDDRLDRRDYEYMKSMYPQTAKRLLPYVEEECDRMEYDGSMMFDEYPDQLQLHMMCSRIYERVKDENGMNMEEDDLEMQQNRSRRRRDDRLRDLIQVILFHELFNRRSDRRKHRRRIY